MYQVEWSKKAQKSLDKIDQVVRKKIVRKVENKLAKDPYKGNVKPLKGKWEGRYRYRFDDYRVIYEVLHTKLLIWVVDVGHRKEIY